MEKTCNLNPREPNDPPPSDSIVDQPTDTHAIVPVIADTTTQKIRSLLGDDVVILPIPRGEKGPRIQGWHHFTTSNLSTDDEAQINAGDLNAGVLLLNGLGVIDLDTDQAVQDFLRVNPDLVSSFLVRGKKGLKIFVRFADGYPVGGQKIRDTDGREIAEILGERKNAVVAGLHPDGMEYCIVTRRQPIQIRFTDIHWPPYFDLGEIVSAEEARTREVLEALKRDYGEPYTLTDHEGNTRVTGFNARFWAAVYATENQIAFLPEQDAFFEYDPETGLFKRQTNASLREKAGKRLFLAAAAENRSEIRDQCTINRLDLIVKGLRGICERREFFADRPSAIHLENGMILHGADGLSFEEGFSPRYRSRNRSPFPFSQEAKCPRFCGELLEPMLPNPADCLLLQKWAGVALFGENLPQRILILAGTSGRGKGVLLRVICGIIGQENIAELRTQHLGERFELNRFVGKTTLVASDVPGDFLLQKWVSSLKSLVGGDPLMPEAKCSNEAVTIKGIFNVLIVSNSRLRCRLDGDVEAWRRRMMILRTDAPAVQKRIPFFENTLLKEEGPGILRWMLEGFEVAMADIDKTGDLHLSEEQRRRVDGLLGESDALTIFIQSCLQKQESQCVTVDELVQRFMNYCFDRGWRPWEQSAVQRDLPDLMLRIHGAAKSNSIKTTDGSRRGFRGVEFIKGEK